MSGAVGPVGLEPTTNGLKVLGAVPLTESGIRITAGQGPNVSTAVTTGMHSDSVSDSVSGMNDHPETTPWPHVSVKIAARMLNVAPELVEGLCANRQLDAVRSTAKNGRPFWLVSKPAVVDLREKMNGQ
jgi:hypothetical protein